MGGIAGIMSVTRIRADVGRVDSMIDAVRQRGPCDKTVWRSSNGKVALGGCRSGLSDARATLPYANESEDVRLVLDGDIDNYRTLRHSLNFAGHRFVSDAPGEVVVHAYEQFGMDFLEHLHGRFAIALWDDRRQCLVLARDRLGERPLYHARVGGGLAFASHARALQDVMDLPRRLDLESLPQYLALGAVMAPRTLLEGVSKLGAGEALVVTRQGQMTPLTWWTPCRDQRRYNAVKSLDRESHQANLRILIDSAIADRLSPGHPVAAIVDHDWESLAMARTTGRLLGRPVDALVFGQETARAITAPAKEVGLHLVPVTPSATALAGHFGDYVEAMDEPVSDPAGVGAWWLARALSSRGAATALHAEGIEATLMGDALIGRYDHAPMPWRRRRRPYWQRSTLLNRLMRLFKGRRAERQGYPSDGLEPVDVQQPPLAARVLREAFRGIFDQYPPAAILTGERRRLPPWLLADEAGAMAALELRMATAENRLCLFDRMAAAHSVEIRYPFLDDALIDYALAIPDRVRTPRGRTLLADALAGVAPVGYPRRRAVANPSAGCFGLEPLFRRATETGTLFVQGLFDRDECKDLLARYTAGDHELQHLLWSVLVLSEWVDRLGLDVVPFAPESVRRQKALG